MGALARAFTLDFSHIDLWRSEEMQLVQLMIPAESAHDTVAALGEVGLLQFKDLNTEKSAFQRTYANQVKRCDEMARKIRFFKDQVDKAELPIPVRPASLERGYELDELEAKLEELETELLEVNANTERLTRSHSELVELQLVLEKAGNFFETARVEAQSENLDRPLTAGEDIGAPLLAESKVGRLGFVAGLIQQEKITNFERLLYRATRGNMFLKQAAVGKVQDPATGEFQEKFVFVIFFSGERARTKVLKICEAFGANRYPFPEDTTRQRQMHGEVSSRLRELHTTIEAGDRLRDGVLHSIASNLDQWTSTVDKEKAIYHTLNKLSIDVTHKVLVAEAWVPITAKPRVHEALRLSAELSSTQVATILQPLVSHDAPPTYFRTNKFTACFQLIVDAYGIARYREVNPAVYTIMTFPFLFAVMFGDFGHGLLMLAFALFLVLNEKKLAKVTNEIFGMAYGGRYCILLMSIFSIYVGLIYNEFFSIPMSLFGTTGFSCKEPFNSTLPFTPTDDMRACGDHHHNGEVTFAKGASPYPLGVDPVWHGTKTELPFLNSMKMKLSILLGVVHMNLGILMSLYNHVFFRDTLSIVCEFIPQVIFLNSLFGYLCLLIIGKWVSGAQTDLYHVMIYMFLSPGNVPKHEVDPKTGVTSPNISTGYMFDGQGGLQGFLVLIAVIAVPWMLIPKPFILKKRHEASTTHRAEEYGVLQNIDDDVEERLVAPAAAAHGGGGGHGHGDHFDFSEILVHQMIHTIEFVLGAVSNTASYLRLWALSLAHSQLSAVFYDRVLMLTVSMNNPVLIFIGFFFFAMATLGVLMVMESLSAFLHALRLHWVEFQNKFYRGDGYEFVPFSFEKVEE